MKLPGKEDFLVRISSSLDASNWVLSRSGRLLPKEGVDSLKLPLGDFLLSSGVGSEDSSLMQRVERSIISPSSTNPLAYCGYLAKTYCSTYCISVGVIGPDHLRSRPWSVDMASATMWAGITVCAFCFHPKFSQAIRTWNYIYIYLGTHETWRKREFEFEFTLTTILLALLFCKGDLGIEVKEDSLSSSSIVA